MTSPLPPSLLESKAPGQSASVRRGLSSLKDYFAAFVLCVAILTVFLRLWDFDFNIPFCAGGDALMVQVWHKTIYEFGWYMENPRLGAPHSLHMGDFPMADGFHQVIYKMLGWISPNYVIAVNLFFFLGFPLTTITALFVFRRFGIGFSTALLGSLLYAFLPYHFFRNIGHIYLTAYYVVPLSLLMILWVHLGRIGLGASPTDFSEEDQNGRRSRWIGCLVIAAIQGCSGVYYGFFACYLLLIAGIAGAFRRRKLFPLYTALALVAVTCGALFINLAPHLLYRWEQGPNPEIAHRTPEGAEAFGMKITRLVLPTPNHRFEPFSELEAHYTRYSIPPGGNENNWSTLGLIGTVGFLVLLAFPISHHRTKTELVPSLSLLNASCVLLGTVGGLGALFSLLVSPMIRGYNRISVFIAFLSFLMVCILLEHLRKSLASRGKPAWIFHGLIGGLLVGGLLDEVPANIMPFSKTLNAQDPSVIQWKSDAEFFAKVEASLPDQAAVFQYPHMNFPESGPVRNVDCYDNCRGYLHTDRLRWSLPMRGRQVDLVIRNLSILPLEEQLKALATGGFLGVCVDRRGYADNGLSLESQLANLLQTTPIASGDGTRTFFSMVDYVDTLKTTLPPEEWESHRNATWFSIFPVWANGFYGMETDGVKTWRWGQSQGRLVLNNPTNQAKTVKLEFVCRTLHPTHSRLSITSPTFSTELEVNYEGAPFSQVFTLPPGRLEIHFSSEAAPVDLPKEPRTLVFSINEFQLIE